MKAKSVKGRPAQITKQEIIKCALEIGLAKVSMHALGKALGVSATALYRHVNSKDDLIIQCCDYVMESVAQPHGEDWETYLYSFGNNFRTALLAIPGSVEFVRYNQQFTPSSCVLVNDALRVLDQSGFDIQKGFMAFATVFTKVTDIVQHQEQALYLKQHSTTESTSDLEGAEHLPYLAQLMSQTEPVNYDEYFSEGLNIVIEGLKAVYR